MTLAPHEFWQEVYAPGTFSAEPDAGYDDVFPATLPDSRQIAFPIRALPGDGQSAVASLIVNQASFAVEDALSDAMANALDPHEPEIIIGVPTLGLPLANAVARRLGHMRMVALGTSRKFWYRDELSEPMSSITSPEQIKRIYLDPRILPLLEGKRVAVVDDVTSSGATLGAVLRLLHQAGIRPAAAAFAMLQGEAWKTVVTASHVPDLKISGAVVTPLLRRGSDGLWYAVDRRP